MSVDLSIHPDVSIEKEGDLSVIVVNNAFATAKITPYGASVLSFKPKAPSTDQDLAQDLLWISPTAVYSGKQPIRGGIPICWPWFGKHPTDLTLPAHGFVRNQEWALEQVQTTENGATVLKFGLKSNEDSLTLWPYAFRLSLTVTIAKDLSLSLKTTNLSAKKMVITEAFHTYFNVQDVHKVCVTGLEGSEHIDTLKNNQSTLQTGKLILSPPIDAVFLNHTSNALIEGVGNGRRISLSKKNSQSTVVWNPGAEIVKGFKDIPNDQWHTFICVESGNVFDNTVTIQPNQTHCMQLTLKP